MVTMPIDYPTPRAMRRFMAKIRVETNGCWEWQGTKLRGYGMFGHRTNGRHQMLYAHRVAYDWFKGSATGFHIDHTCVNPACVNPWHLDLVTVAENNRRMGMRRTHCRNGLHALVGENVRIERGYRICVACARARAREGYHRRKRVASALVALRASR